MKKTLFTISAYALPMAVFAGDETVGGLIPLIQNIISALTPIVIALALLYFFWGLAKYILAAGSEEAKESGKNIMIWGIIALFVMVSVWGIIRILGDTLGIDQGGNLDDVPGVGF
jgi:fumarate reductase subunit D